MSKLLDSIRDAAAARRALDGEKSAASAGEPAAPHGAATGDDSPLLSAMRRSNEINATAASAAGANAAVPVVAGDKREMEAAHNAIGAAQTREAVERGTAAMMQRKAQAEAAARQLALERIEAEQRAEAAAHARITAERQAADEAVARAKSEREAEEAARRNVVVQQEAVAAARAREGAAAQAAEAAQARAQAETALQTEIAARAEAERRAAARERDRLRAEEAAAQAAAARAALEAQRAVERDAPPQARPSTPGIWLRAKAALSQRAALIAGAMAVLLIGIAIGDWAGRNAVLNAALNAQVAARAMAGTMPMQLRVDDDVDAFGRRVQTRAANPKTAPRKKAAGEN